MFPIDSFLCAMCRSCSRMSWANSHACNWATRATRRRLFHFPSRRFNCAIICTQLGLYCCCCSRGRCDSPNSPLIRPVADRKVAPERDPLPDASSSKPLLFMLLPSTLFSSLPLPSLSSSLRRNPANVLAWLGPAALPGARPNGSPKGTALKSASTRESCSACWAAWALAWSSSGVGAE